MIAVTMPERQPGEATEKIIKAVNSLSGVWALSENHNLYRIQLENNEPDMSTMEAAYQNVQDFSLGSFGEYINIQYTTGRLERYWTDHDYGELPEPPEGVAEISGCAALMQDGTVQYHYDGAWHSIEDIKAGKIAEDKGQRLLVLDQNNTLWDYSMEDGSYLFFAPNYGEKPAVFSLPMKGVYAEARMWDGYYLIACTDGRLYYHLDESTDERNPYDGAEWVWTLGVQN